MWPKATSKIELTVSFPYLRVAQNTKINLHSKIELECKDISQCKFETAKASRRVKLSMNKFVSFYFSTEEKFDVEISTERLHIAPVDTVSSVCISCFFYLFSRCVLFSARN